MLRALDNIRISTKLPAAILLAAGVVAAAVGAIGYIISRFQAIRRMRRPSSGLLRLSIRDASSSVTI